YWLTLFAFNILVLPMVAGAWYGWLLLTGPRAKRVPLTPTVETQRIWRMWLILAAFCMAAYWGGSYFAEQDAAWHQVTLRDTAFTPSHIALFYGAFPLMIYLSFGAFLYARTRLPHLYGSGRAFPVSYAFVVGGSMLLVFQVAFNEFGHTFWETEEIFSAPLHWPFVLFAYLIIATFAVWFQSLPRVLELVRAEAEGRTTAGVRS
ncbi:MAG: methane monooxygenase/ammonia monooxygenase subunit C, partial [Dehalococcoidia bacterium]